MSCVAVLDLGSNSFKALVATHRDGQVVAVDHLTIDSRISVGLGNQEPRISAESIERAVQAIKDMQRMIATHAPRDVAIVATSAVREAANRVEFVHRIKEETGLSIRVLSGDEEARLIGRGLLTDPLLADFSDFYVFDLGGGSLECLEFTQRSPARAISLPLGSVRLCEQLVTDPAQPLPPAENRAIRDRVLTQLAGAGLQLDGSAKPAVFSGGSLTTSRMILAEARGVAIGDTPALMTVPALDALFHKLSHMTLEERRLVPGMPERRADIMPAALATILALAEAGGFTGFHHSLYSLRWGLADDMLKRLES